MKEGSKGDKKEGRTDGRTDGRKGVTFNKGPKGEEEKGGGLAVGYHHF